MADSDFKYDPRDFVGVLTPGFVVIGVKDLAKFDEINALVQDMQHDDGTRVLIKTVENNSVTVVFQHWLRSLTVDAMIEGSQAAKAAMQVLLEYNPLAEEGTSGMVAYGWSDQNGYECEITVPLGVQGHLDDDEVAALERVIAKPGVYNAR